MGKTRASSTFVIGDCTNTRSLLLATLLTSVYYWTNNPNPKEKIVKQTPYDTGKVKIGLTYTPPQPPPTPEDEWAQSILLGDRQGLSDLELTTIQSLAAIAVIVLVMLITGGSSNA